MGEFKVDLERLQAAQVHVHAEDADTAARLALECADECDWVLVDTVVLGAKRLPDE